MVLKPLDLIQYTSFNLLVPYHRVYELSEFKSKYFVCPLHIHGFIFWYFCVQSYLFAHLQEIQKYACIVFKVS